jgi:hypothetical protein
MSSLVSDLDSAQPCSQPASCMGKVNRNCICEINRCCFPNMPKPLTYILLCQLTIINSHFYLLKIIFSCLSSLVSKVIVFHQPHQIVVCRQDWLGALVPHHLLQPIHKHHTSTTPPRPLSPLCRRYASHSCVPCAIPACKLIWRLISTYLGIG